jgi:hypothetical protein
MPEQQSFERRRYLIEAMGALAAARSVDELVTALCSRGRAIAQSDGVTVIRREGDEVSYIAEDAQTSLWAGKRFPIAKCISGLAIVEQRSILIPNIFADMRVPHAAYRPTFVRSMAMYPIGREQRGMAMGAYWKTTGDIDPLANSMLTSLAQMAGLTLNRLLAGAVAQPQQPVLQVV